MNRRISTWLIRLVLAFTMGGVALSAAAQGGAPAHYSYGRLMLNSVARDGCWVARSYDEYVSFLQQLGGQNRPPIKFGVGNVALIVATSSPMEYQGVSVPSGSVQVYLAPPSKPVPNKGWVIVVPAGYYHAGSCAVVFNRRQLASNQWVTTTTTTTRSGSLDSAEEEGWHDSFHAADPSTMLPDNPN